MSISLGTRNFFQQRFFLERWDFFGAKVMSALMLEKLPPAPDDCTDWPWTVESNAVSGPRPDGSDWPQISIVMPSFNQGQFIEEAIRSILLQGYPNLELIVIDGGSTDDTVTILQRYAPWLAYWVSEPDRGQADAINKGLALARGEIFQFINSDDVLVKDVLRKVGCQSDAADAFAGPVQDFGNASAKKSSNQNLNIKCLIKYGGISPLCEFHQPGVFLKTSKVKAIGGYDESFRYVFDYKFMIEYLDRFPIVHWSYSTMVMFRLHPNSKTVHENSQFEAEFMRARLELAQSALSKSARRYLKVTVEKLAWPAKIAKFREKNPRKLPMLCFLVRSCLTSPRVTCSRMTLGAIRRELIGNSV